jgi:hypothetical protein
VGEDGVAAADACGVDGGESGMPTLSELRSVI